MNVTEGSRYKSLTSESKYLLLGHYAELPGEVDKNLLSSIEEEKIQKEPHEEIGEKKEEFKNLCIENGLPDLSENLESLLTYILFSNIAIRFFKSRSFG